MTKPRVFLTRRLPDEVLRLAGETFELEIGPEGATIPRALLQEKLRTADAIVTMLNDRIDRELLEGAPCLRHIANYAAGYNNIDLEAANALGIWATNTPDATTEATADIAMGLMVAAARQFAASERSLRMGEFVGWAPRLFLGPELSGATLGIIGMGRIGQAVARRALGFGMEILYHSRRPIEGERQLHARWVPFETLLERSDFVSLHCPLTEQTRHLIDEKALERMKPGSVLVNTSRGPVVDEEALAHALHRGHLAGAGLDVYEQEPLIHPALMTAPRAVLLPHVGTSTIQARLKMGRKAWEDVRRVLEGERPLHPVNAPATPRPLPSIQ